MISRTRCHCGRTIWRGDYHHRTGPGLAKFWVLNTNPIWLHYDWTEACHPAPGPTMTRQAGHTHPAEHLWLVFAAVAILLAARLAGMAL